MWDAWTKGPIASALAQNRKAPFIRPGDWRRLNQVHDLAMPRDQWDALGKPEKKAFLLKVKAIVVERRRASRGGPAPAE